MTATELCEINRRNELAKAMNWRASPITKHLLHHKEMLAEKELLKIDDITIKEKRNKR